MRGARLQLETAQRAFDLIRCQECQDGQTSGAGVHREPKADLDAAWRHPWTGQALALNEDHFGPVANTEADRSFKVAM